MWRSRKSAKDALKPPFSTQTVFHNKESLVLIRSVRRGLVLHFPFFKNAIRDFDAIVKGQRRKIEALLKVDIIITAGPQATRPAKQATSTIPIVIS